MISSLQGVVHSNHIETQKFAHDQLKESTSSETQTSKETIESISQTFKSAELHPKTQEALIRSHIEQKMVKEDPSVLTIGPVELTTSEQIDFQDILGDLLTIPVNLKGTSVDNPIVVDLEQSDASSSRPNVACCIEITEQNRQMLDEIRSYLKIPTQPEVRKKSTPIKTDTVRKSKTSWTLNLLISLAGFVASNQKKYSSGRGELSFTGWMVVADEMANLFKDEKFNGRSCQAAYRSYIKNKPTQS